MEEDRLQHPARRCITAADMACAESAGLSQSLRLLLAYSGAMTLIHSWYEMCWTPLMIGFLTTYNSWSPLGAAPIIPGIFLVVISLLYVVQTRPQVQWNKTFLRSYIALLAINACLHHMQIMRKKRTDTNHCAT